MNNTKTQGFHRMQAYGPGLAYRRRQWISFKSADDADPPKRFNRIRRRFSLDNLKDHPGGLGKSTVIDTMARVNAALKSDPNALTSTKAGEVNPDAAYVEVIRDLIQLV